MIGRLHRFHGHNALRRVYTHGRSVRGAMLSLKFMPAKGQNYRAAVVVSRKVHKSAVVRNRIRRRLYEIVREYAQEFSSPHDLVFTVFSDQAAELPASELSHRVRKLLQSAGVLDDKSPQAHTPSHGIVEPKD